MKTMYKVIVAMMVMAVTAAPAAAKSNVDRNARPDKKEVRMTGHKYDRFIDKKQDRDRRVATLEVTTFKVSQKSVTQKNVVRAAKAVYGVKDVKWNPRNNMMIVTYDAKKTTARRIKAAVY